MLTNQMKCSTNTHVQKIEDRISRSTKNPDRFYCNLDDDVMGRFEEKQRDDKVQNQLGKQKNFHASNEWVVGTLEI